MQIAPLFAAALVLASAGCSSSNGQSGGLTGPGADNSDSAPDVNPDGVPYPTNNIGNVPRRGAVKGNTIQNFKFVGYPNGDPSQGLQPISLAQYFDPTGSRYRVIHIQASGTWCAACREETNVVVPMKAELDAKKAVWLVSIAEGPTQGLPSKKEDMDNWISEFKSPFPHWIDPGNQQLGIFYDAAALPWNANIDARTMEILTSGVGAVVTRAGILKEIDDAIAASDATK